MSNKMVIIRRAVGAIIGWTDNPGNVLLVKKVRTEDITKEAIPPEWDIPKGGLKDQERDVDGLWRELAEEVGSSEFRLVQKLPFGMNFPFPPKSKWDKQETSLFYLEYSGPPMKFEPDTGEISEVKWFPLEEAKRTVSYGTTLMVIEESERLGLLR